MLFRDFNNKIIEYKNDKVKPAIETTLNMFKVTFPNMNYKFDESNQVSDNVVNNVVNKSDEEIIIEAIIENN